MIFWKKFIKIVSSKKIDIKQLRLNTRSRGYALTMPAVRSRGNSFRAHYNSLLHLIKI